VKKENTQLNSNLSGKVDTSSISSIVSELGYGKAVSGEFTSIELTLNLSFNPRLIFMTDYYNRVIYFTGRFETDTWNPSTNVKLANYYYKLDNGTMSLLDDGFYIKVNNAKKTVYLYMGNGYTASYIVLG
jgi:hypothetical protein